jgi:hypothetical protein
MSQSRLRFDKRRGNSSANPRWIVEMEPIFPRKAETVVKKNTRGSRLDLVIINSVWRDL